MRNTHVATTKASVRYKLHLTETVALKSKHNVFRVLLIILYFLYFIYITVESNITAAYIPV